MFKISVHNKHPAKYKLLRKVICFAVFSGLIHISHVLFSPGNGFRFHIDDAASAPAKTKTAVHPLTLHYSYARFLKNNKPYITFVVTAFPHTQEKEIALSNTLMVKDADWNELSRLESNPPLTSSYYTTVFETAHTHENNHFLLAAQAYHIESIGEMVNSIPLNPGLHAGKTIVEDIKPLATDTEVMELSDLVVGLEFEEEFSGNEFAYPILPLAEVKTQNLLSVYFEIYHLFLDADNRSKYKVDYKVTKHIKRNIFSLFRRKKAEQLANTGLSESNSRNSEERIDFDISEFSPGDYEFAVEITDLVSGQKNSRKQNFSLIK